MTTDCRKTEFSISSLKLSYKLKVTGEISKKNLHNLQLGLQREVFMREQPFSGTICR